MTGAFMDQQEKLSWWGRIKQRYNRWKLDWSFQTRYKKKLDEIKKKEPYTKDNR